MPPPKDPTDLEDKFLREQMSDGARIIAKTLSDRWLLVIKGDGKCPSPQQVLNYSKYEFNSDDKSDGLNTLYYTGQHGSMTDRQFDGSEFYTIFWTLAEGS